MRGGRGVKGGGAKIISEVLRVEYDDMWLIRLQGEHIL